MTSFFFLVHTSCVCSILTKYVFPYTVTKLGYVTYHVWYFKSFLFSQKIVLLLFKVPVTLMFFYFGRKVKSFMDTN